MHQLREMSSRRVNLVFAPELLSLYYYSKKYKHKISELKAQSLLVLSK
jgi:hypothetical protein